MRTISIALLAATLLGAVASSADEPAKPASDVVKGQPGECYFIRDIGNWKASADSKNIFLRVDRHHVLRLELAASCPGLNWPDARLINRWRSTVGSFCDALDWDLTVTQGFREGPVVACIVKKMVPMSQEEVEALPPKQRP